MQLFKTLIWNNIYLLRITSLFFVALLSYVVWIKNVYKIKKKINTIKISETSKFYWHIFYKHFIEKKILIFIFFFITIILFFINNPYTQSLLGVTASAMIAVLFLDSINQYIAEKKFIETTREVRTKIYSLYYTFCDLIFILDKENLSSEFVSKYKNTNNIIEMLRELEVYCKNATFRNNNEFTEDESHYANYYLKKIRNDIETTIQIIKYTSPNIEIYSLLFFLNNLFGEFKNKNNDFFTHNPRTSIIFGGINASFVKNSLEKYISTLYSLDNNLVLKPLKLTYRQEVYMHVKMPSIEELRKGN